MTKYIVDTWLDEDNAMQRKHTRKAWCLYFGMVLFSLVVWTFVLRGCCHASDEPNNKIVISSAHIDLAIIAKIESGGHPEAYNSHSGAVGLYQITPICLKDYNKYHEPFMLANMYDRSMASTVADWYLNTRIPCLLRSMAIKDTIKNRLFAYNAGIGKVKRGIMPKETRDYIKKYYLRRGKCLAVEL